MESLVVLPLSYLLGSIPTAYLLGRLVRDADIRRLGTENVGALNAYRELGRWIGAVVLVVDTGKGAFAIVIGRLLGAPDVTLYVASLLATLGHNFSPFAGFRGGKGGATVLGISAVMLWHLTAASLGVGLIVLAVTRHAVWSLTAVFVALNALTIGTGQPIGQIIICLVLSFVVAGTHVLRQRPEIVPAVMRRDWRRLMSIE